MGLTGGRIPGWKQAERHIPRLPPYGLARVAWCHIARELWSNLTAWTHNGTAFGRGEHCLLLHSVGVLGTQMRRLSLNDEFRVERNGTTNHIWIVPSIGWARQS